MTTGATATVKGGFFPTNGVSSLTQISGKGSLRRTVAQIFGRKSYRDQRELMVTLNGVVAGSTASDTNGRVQAAEELGGKRTIESETIVNRATVAGDITELTADFLTLSSRTYDPTPVANGDGNPLGTR